MPICDCHGEPMLRDGHTPHGSQKWTCRVRNRQRDRNNWDARAAANNYRRAINLRKQRMAEKLERIKDLEAFLEEEN